MLVQFFFLILAIFLLIAFFIGAFVVRFLRMLFAGKPRTASSSRQQPHTTYRSTGTSGTHAQEQAGARQRAARGNRSGTHAHPKIFGKDEGEYVDFEEIKD